MCIVCCLFGSVFAEAFDGALLCHLATSEWAENRYRRAGADYTVDQDLAAAMVVSL